MSEKTICGKVLSGNGEYHCSLPVDAEGKHPGICAYIEVMDQKPQLVPPSDGVFVMNGSDAVMIENQLLKEKGVTFVLNGTRYHLRLVE